MARTKNEVPTGERSSPATTSVQMISASRITEAYTPYFCRILGTLREKVIPRRCRKTPSPGNGQIPHHIRPTKNQLKTMLGQIKPHERKTATLLRASPGPKSPEITTRAKRISPA